MSMFVKRRLRPGERGWLDRCDSVLDEDVSRIDGGKTSAGFSGRLLPATTTTLEEETAYTVKEFGPQTAVIAMRQTPLLLLLLLAEMLSLTNARATRLVQGDVASSDPRRGICHTRPARLLRIQLGSGFNQTLMSLAEPDQGKRKDDHPLAESIRNTGTDSARHSVLPANGKLALQRLLQRALEASISSANPSSDAPVSAHSTHSRHLPVRGNANYFAQNATSANSPLPWSCQMETVWKKMRPGIFPPYVQTGRCVQRSCMFGACECVPKKYVMKILKRVPNVCNPVPGVGDRTRYEDAWVVSRITVTVHCECSRRRALQKALAIAAT